MNINIKFKLIFLFLNFLTFKKTFGIINGTETTKSYPWMTVIYKDNDQLCGGSLIAPNVILTAAHCLFDVKRIQKPEGINFESILVKDLKTFRIEMNRHDLDNQNEDYSQYEVEEILPHPSYEGRRPNKVDVGLIKLKSNAIKKSKTDITPVMMDLDGRFISPGTKIKTMGWGMINPDAEKKIKSKKLLEIDLTILSNDTCKERSPAYQKDPNNSYNIASAVEICSIGNNAVSCGGDSGGPKFFEENGKAIVVSVVSRGQGCSFTEFSPNLSLIKDWINQHVNQWKN